MKTSRKHSDPNILNNFNKNESEVNSNEDDYDYVEIKNSDTVVSFKDTHDRLNNAHKMMPHEKNAINFLINEYLLEQNYKMTSVTFSEENESQDLEDWDVIGVNRSKPPNLGQIYKLYLKKCSTEEAPKVASAQSRADSAEKVFAEIGLQISPESSSQSANTEAIATRCFESFVNFDNDAFDNQRMQIAKLIEKQEILLKSIAKLDKEVNNLNLEREENLKKIDLL